jgi:periplasmic protein TonB
MMPSTAKDSLFEATTAEGMAKSEMQGSQPSDAIGAEVPVTVHASRYSATSKGAGKLPPVHEETRTVIIFPQGAVVRLSAMVSPGELVVVTNNRTGADVICRVTSVKTQPGIQNYVNLEFTQRALGFWEEPRQAERSVAKDKAPLGVVSSAPLPQVPTPITAVPKVSMPTVLPESTARASAPSVEAKPAFSQPLKVTSLADAPAGKSRDAVQQIPIAATPISEIPSAPAISTNQPRIVPSRVPRLESFDSAGLQEAKDQENKGPNNSKRVVLILTAAIVLLAIGAVGGALFLRWNRALAVTQQASTAPVSTATSEPVATMSAPGLATAGAVPVANTPVKSNSVAPASSIATLPSNAGPGSSTVPQSTPVRLSIETPKVEVRSEPQPQPKVEARSEPLPQPTMRSNIGMAKISAPNMKTAPKINALEPPPVLTADPAALPKGINVANTFGASGSIASPGAPPAAIKGGQLVQPKLISSLASSYPAAAKAAHAEGDVLIDALIDSTGKVAATKVISGSPLLQQAAVDSLHFWKYEPARLNGEPIPIHIKVSVNFRLQ